MERKRIEKLVVLLLIGILLPVSLFPFRIEADTISTSNITYNYYLTDVVDSTSQLANKNYIYDVDFIFDKSYLGWVSVSMITSYVYDTGDTRQATYTKAIYVNGNTAKTSIVISSNYTGVNGSPLTSMSITVNNSNVTPLADLSSLQDIIDLLQDIDNHISIDILDELENIVANTSLSNDYLQLISKIRNYDIPFESLLITTYFNSYHDPEDIYLSGVYDFKFPIYKMSGRSFRLYGNAGHQYKMIVMAKSSTMSAFNNAFSVSPNTGMSLISASYSGNTYFFRQSYLYLMTFTFQCNTSNNYYFDYVGSDTSYYIVPIYYGDVNNKNISTDFALRFGLSNSLLDNLQIIANGTNQSSSASGSLDQNTSQFSSDASDLVTIEESFNDSMNDSLENVSPVFNMGSSFLTSANWVSQQFNRIVNNTPFASLITFGLTLGLGLLIIGKVRK